VEFKGRYQIKFSHRFAALRNLDNKENTSILFGKLSHKTSKSQESQYTRYIIRNESSIKHGLIEKIMNIHNV